ncbi:MAG: hypothetical protein IIU18_00820 [Oscillospiraceae bacterium]|jgi:hypothetical protein|nr:hypothetical protein [Oscillospiraceae bacterium]
MKARFESSFERGQELVRYCMFGAVATGVCALVFTETGSVAQMVLIFLSAGLLAAMLVCAAKFCRCPSCGKRIIAGALAVTVCPNCRRDLRSGRKVKKSRR